MSNEQHPSNPYAVPETTSVASPAYVPGVDPEQKVRPPAIFIMVVAGTGSALALIGLMINLLSVGVGAMQFNAIPRDQDAASELFMSFGQGIFGIAQAVVGIIVGIVCFLGANKMRQLSSYNFAMISSTLIMIPCLSPCCILGLPAGIWGLIVLNDQSVKSAFRN